MKVDYVVIPKKSLNASQLTTMMNYHATQGYQYCDSDRDYVYMERIMEIDQS